MATVLESLREFITPQLIHQAAQAFDESESGISKALGGLAPTILAGMIQKSGDDSTMDVLFRGLSNFNTAGLDNPAGLLAAGNLAHHDPKDDAGHLLGTLFGDKVPAITNAVAAFSGTKTTTVSSLLGVAGPLVMGLLSRQISSEDLSVPGLINLLKGQKNSILGALPPGVHALIGLSDQPASQAAPAGEASTGNSWLMPLLLLLGLGAAIMFYTRHCTAPKVETPATLPATDTLPAPVTAAPAYQHTLGTGVDIKGNPDGIERKLIEFIKSDAPVDKTTWFSFDRLTFQTGSAVIDMEKSNDQLMNIYNILKAYPKVKLKVGGYTDNVGKPADNMKLSQARAEATVKALIGLGVEAGRLTPEGYGDKHPVASNDTEEGRAQNRRIDVRVTEK